MQNLQERVRLFAVLALALLCFGTVQPLHAANITTLFSTGVDSSGNPLGNGAHDPHYGVAGGTFVIGNPGSVGWIGNTGTSSWISNDPSTFGGGGPFDYQTTFDLTGLNPTTAQITGLLAADDQATISLNGNVVFVGAPTSSSPWSFLQNFHINSGFVSGVNTLDILVPNNIQTADDGPTGLQIDITSATATTPEPASLTLLGLGLGALKLFRRKA